MAACPDWARALLRRHLTEIEARVGRLRRNSKGQLVLIGVGTFGAVFALEDVSRVFKLTRDDSEGVLGNYVKALQDAHTRFGATSIIEGTARVYDVFRFPNSREFFGMVRERVECALGAVGLLGPLADQYRDAWNTACLGRTKKIRIEGETEARQLLKMMGKLPQGKALSTVLLGTWALGVPLMDAHIGNLCVRSQSTDIGGRPGQLVLMDYGAGERGSLASPGSLNRLLRTPIPVFG